MVLSDYDILKFQKLYKERFGKDISREEAYEKGIKLLRLMSLSYKPMNENEFNRIQEHRKVTLPLLINKITQL